MRARLRRRHLELARCKHALRIEHDRRRFGIPRQTPEREEENACCGDDENESPSTHELLRGRRVVVRVGDSGTTTSAAFADLVSRLPRTTTLLESAAVSPG